MAFTLNRQIIGGIVPALLTVSILVEICFAQNVPAFFVFGDSLVDPGNNNYIVSLTKANYIPNGIDFGMPTGRFTNGRTIVDIIGQELGFKDYLPPYLAPTTAGVVILQGVNYASGGGGILNDTGKIFGGRINLDAQIDNFANSWQDIISSIGAPEALTLFGKAFFSVTIGSNDFLDNYLTPVISAVKQKLVTPNVFVGAMISRYRLQLMRLYNLGARKIIVANVGPIGCIPYQRDINLSTGPDCVSFSNQLAQLFNAKLKCLITDLGSNLQGSKFVYADAYSIVEDILKNYITYGFENANSACCYLVGRFGGLTPCGPLSKVCSDRSKYVYWDPFHPTEATNVLIARRFMDGDTNDITPMNIRFGIFPSWGLSQKLSRIIGPNKAREVSLTATPLTAEVAERLGFVNYVVEEGELLKKAREIGEGILKNNQDLVLRYKSVINDGLKLDLGHALALEKERAHDYYNGMTKEQFEKMQQFIAGRSSKKPSSKL